MDTPTTPTTPLPTIFEAELAEKLGVARPILTEARLAVLTDDDVERKKGGLAYTPAAVAKVCAHLHLDLPAHFLQPDAEEKTPGVRTVTVRRLARLNRHILFATEKDGGPEISVRVRDTRMFVIGQEIHVRLEGDIAHLYGPQPRRRGRSRPA